MNKKFKVLTQIYNATAIHFEIDNENLSETEIMVNATEMINLFPEKRMYDFLTPKKNLIYILKLLLTKIIDDNSRQYIENLINNIEKNKVNDEKSRYYFDECEELLKENKIITTNKKGGTYMCRKLALKFAAWLDVEFEIWLFDVIEKLMFSEYGVKLRNIYLAIKQNKDATELLQYKILNGQHTEDEPKKHVELLIELAKLKSMQRKLTNQNIKAIQSSLEIIYED